MCVCLSDFFLSMYYIDAVHVLLLFTVLIISTFHLALSGIPQGSVLGQYLPDNIRSSVHLFADDCVLYRNINSLTDCQILQDDLNSHAQWETDWQMKFNAAKCHSKRVTRHLPSNQIHVNYSLHQQTLEQVRSAKYLGLTITDDLE